MLPDPHHVPAERRKTPISVAIAVDVAPQLRPPKLGVGARPGRVLWASVPETTIDEDSNALLRKGDIDTSTTIELELSL
jgi:hypothetical protein